MMHPTPVASWPTTPIERRFSAVARGAWIVLVALAVAVPAQSAEPKGKSQRRLSEADSVRLALARPAVETLTTGRVALARSEVTAAGRWPNPELEYTYEEVNRQPVDSSEGSFWLSQRFELSGQRTLRTEAAEHRVGAAELASAADRATIAADTRARFYEVLHQQERVAAIEGWLRRLGSIEAVIRKGEAAGDVAGYDALRLSRERASAQTALQKERAQYQRLWAELSSLLGGSEAIAGYSGVAGQLLPDPPPALAQLLDAVGQRPDIRRLAREVDAHDLEQRAGARGWVPELTLGVGQKTVDDELGRDSGPMVAAGITIPLFDHGQSEQQRAAASAAIARGQQQLEQALAEGKVRGLWQEASTLTQAAREQRRGAREAAARLITVAEAAYRGGELGVLELLDAYRGAHEADLQALEIAAAARQARVELDRLTGGPAQ